MNQADGAQILKQAFAAFNEQSVQLENSYRELQEQVEVLTRELAAARSERLLQLAEKERLASRLERLLDTLPGGVVVLDGEGRISEFNPVALEMLGEPLQGREWRDVMKRARATNAQGELQLESGRRISLARRRLVAEPGQIILLTDVTETRHLQSLLERNQRLSEMGEMAARLAHQIRTPLSCAMLYSSHLQRTTLTTERRQRYAGKVTSRLQQLERMVDDMLVFARGGRSASEAFSVTGLFDEVAQVLEAQLGHADRIIIDDCTDIAPLRGNREALLGALCNLGNNAIQAGDGNAIIRFTAASLPGGDVELTVIDNGPGMPAKTRARIFEPFFTTRPGGTGLGLAVVRSTARAHGGDVTVKSTPGTGTSFRLRLANGARDKALPSGCGQERGRSIDFTGAKVSRRATTPEEVSTHRLAEFVSATAQQRCTAVLRTPGISRKHTTAPAKDTA
ncbi:MAG: PAS domain-containing protein [Gammaproteobacteria bacterium]|nr:PAS domain-containing protein [Gammaproteobacteria bacterium]